MANDVVLTGTAYQNIYAATSITVGTAVTLQNKSSTPVTIQFASSAPLTSSTNGFVIPPLGFFSVPASVVGLWAKGTGALAVA